MPSGCAPTRWTRCFVAADASRPPGAFLSQRFAARGGWARCRPSTTPPPGEVQAHDPSPPAWRPPSRCTSPSPAPRSCSALRAVGAQGLVRPPRLRLRMGDGHGRRGGRSLHPQQRQPAVGRFSPIHILAVVALVGVSSAIHAVVHRKIALHRKIMQRTYFAACVCRPVHAAARPLPATCCGTTAWA